MQIGAIYPQTELSGDPDAVRRLGTLFENLGYDHLLAFDHVLGAVHEDRNPPLAGPYDENDPFHDPFVLFSYLAARTERLKFVTGVLVLPQRPTALVARQAADLALLSGDRLTVGVGVGWNRVEYDVLGQDFRTRGARLEGQIELLRLLWTERVVTFDGAFESIDRAGSLPLPARPIPIWLGGFVDASFERGARLGEGFIYFGPIDEAVRQWERTRGLLVKHNRPIDGFGVERMTREPDVTNVVREVEQWAEQGGTHVAIGSLRLGLDSIAAHEDYFSAVAEALHANGHSLHGVSPA